MKSFITLASFFAITLNGYADTVVYSTVSTTPVGSTVTLDVDLSSDSQVAGFNFAFSFPPRLLQATDVSELGFFSTQGCCFGFTIDNSQGRIDGISDFVFGSATDITSPTSPDTLVSLQFHAVAPGNAAVQLTCAQGDTFPCNTYPILWDGNGNSIPTILLSPEVTITPDLATATPEPTIVVPLLLISLLLVVTLARRIKCRT
jgi:hypothetical protein